METNFISICLTRLSLKKSCTPPKARSRPDVYSYRFEISSFEIHPRPDASKVRAGCACGAEAVSAPA